MSSGHSHLPNDSPEPDETVEIEILRRFPGRIVMAEPDGTLYLGHNYDIHRSRDAGAHWERIGALPRSPLRRVAEVSRMACRLLRQEIRAFNRLGGEEFVAANREGVFRGAAGDREWQPSRIEGVEGYRFQPPMRLTVGPDGVVLFGEYGNSFDARPTRLFASRDGARSFQRIHTFPPGEVFHVHNVVHDPALGHYWVLVGDFDDQPGIGILSADLERFEWLRKGEQRYRAVEIFDLGDRLLYATDTQLEENALVTMDKATGEIERHRSFDGSCIYACRFGELYALTTTVEDSDVNKSPWASLWISRDGMRWSRAYRADKDAWNAKYFQFGSIVLPTGDTGSDLIVFSGQAVRGLDGETIVAHLAG